ncbi:MAG: PIG-L family deacetylase [Proteobacteria bacterium]|nr:PIG-L family deacetylase [Pseudomonadota bacterium]
MTKRILIVAPHPDDETLGCGGVMKKFTNRRDDVFVLVMTRGNPRLYAEEKIDNIRKEARTAHDLLGVAETRFLDFLAPELDTTSIAEIARSIAGVIAEFEINTLFLPHRGDIHHDHQIVFDAGLVASRPVGKYSVTGVYAYETLSETEWAAPFGDQVFIPTCFYDISAEMEKKLEAISCFKSQLRAFPNPRSLENIEALAKFRGATVGFKRAEAFSVIRDINI